MTAVPTTWTITRDKHNGHVPSQTYPISPNCRRYDMVYRVDIISYEPSGMGSASDSSRPNLLRRPQYTNNDLAAAHNKFPCKYREVPRGTSELRRHDGPAWPPHASRGRTNDKLRGIAAPAGSPLSKITLMLQTGRSDTQAAGGLTMFVTPREQRNGKIRG
jgi:hypothetical protein